MAGVPWRLDIPRMGASGNACQFSLELTATEQKCLSCATLHHRGPHLSGLMISFAKRKESVFVCRCKIFTC